MQKGSFVGTGSQLDVRTVTFRPSRVELFNADGLVTAMWQSTMPDAAMMKMITDGTTSYVTGGNGVTPLSDGFRVGPDGDLNVADEAVHWAAYE